LCFATRPDSVIVLAAACVSGPLRASALPRRWRACLALLAPTAALAAGLTLWRLASFGDVVPNTFHAKIGVDAGARLLAGAIYLGQSLHLVPVVTLAAVAAWRSWGRAAPRLTPPLAGLSAYIAYALWAGGDHMPGARLLVPVLPLAALVLAVAVAHLPRREALVWTVVAVLSGGAAALLAERQAMDPAAFVGRLVGEHIARAWPPGSLVALNTAGSVPFHAPGLRFIDMLGLNDATIARREVGAPVLERQRLPGHGKGDGLYVLSRAPDFVILGPAEGETVDHPWFLSDLELARAERFRACYKMEQIPIFYDAATAAQGPRRHRPLLFTYHRKICGVPVWAVWPHNPQTKF
jgi:hypothetical protein